MPLLLVGEGPVLVLHEGWGRTPDVDRVLERLSQVGLTGVAPDLFTSRSAWRAAPVAAASLPFRTGIAFEQAATAFREYQPRAVLGFSLGAAIALRSEWAVPMVAAYGHVPRHMRARGPILGIYGTADRLLRPSGRRLAAHHRADVLWYEGAGHSFLATAVPSVGRVLGPHPSAEEAWGAVIDFLVASAAVRS